MVNKARSKHPGYLYGKSYLAQYEKVCKARSIQENTAPFHMKHTRYGLTVYPYYDFYIASCLELYGEWSQIEIDFLCSLLSPGDTVIDAGAFIGTHTLSFAQKVGVTGTVHSFEPTPYSYQCLVSNVTINNYFKTELHNVALGSETKKLSLRYPSLLTLENFGGASTMFDLDIVLHDMAHYKTVNVITIDSLEFKRCNLIKIDAEGMSLAVLAGAKKTISKHRPFISVEVESETEKEETNEIIKLMDQHNYSVYNFYTPLYNHNNFFGNEGNVFPRIVSLNLLLSPNEKKIDNLQKVSL